MGGADGQGHPEVLASGCSSIFLENCYSNLALGAVRLSAVVVNSSGPAGLDDLPAAGARMTLESCSSNCNLCDSTYIAANSHHNEFMVEIASSEMESYSFIASHVVFIC